MRFLIRLWIQTFGLLTAWFVNTVSEKSENQQILPRFHKERVQKLNTFYAPSNTNMPTCFISSDYNSTIDISTTTRAVSNNSSSIYSVYYQNVSGMRTKARDFVLFMSAREYDIIIITETWLNDKINSEEYFDNYYTVYRHDRCCTISEKNKGGGILVAVRADFKSEFVSLSFTNIVEQLCVKLTFANNYTIFIVTSYIPPCSDFETYRYHLDNIQYLLDGLDLNQYVLVFGDFNLPNINWNFEDNILLPYNIINDIDEYVTGFFLLNSLNQYNSFRNDIGRILDLIFSNDFIKVSCNLAGSPVSQNSVHHKALDFNFEFFLLIVI